MNPIKLVAHRGHQSKYPENTLLSLAAAIQAGARHVETDVQLSLDHVPVLYHDRDMSRISNCNGSIHEYSFAELIHIPAHEPERFGEAFIQQCITPLADLARLLVTNPQVHAFIEIKRCAIEANEIEMLYQRITEVLIPVVEQCTLISFSIPFIEYATATAWPSLGVVIEDWQALGSKSIQGIKPDYVFCNEKHLPQSGRIAQESSKLVVYEIDDPQKAILLIERGADLIETFAFSELQTTLDQRFNPET